jgi:hypothetical protein
MNATSERPGSNRDPEQLERAADRIRADLDRTLDALERKLSPSQLIDRSLAYLREHGGELAYAVGESVRRNPVPIMLTVAGLGSLIVAATRTREPIDVTIGEQYDGESDDFSLDEQDAGDEASYAESTPRSRFYDRVEAARTRARRARYEVISSIEERPLLFAGLAVAIGALLGAVLPATEYEDKVVGELRDRAVARAKQMGERQYQNLRSQFDRHHDDLEVSGQAH